MKSIILVRHAKSNWDNPLQKDFDRPLNERGIKDAPLMAERLKVRNVKVDAFISSPAKRAITTAYYFAESFGLNKKQVIQVPELYHAPLHQFYYTIADINDSYDTVVIFSHNAGITEFVNTLTNIRVDNMPTCSMFAVKTEIDSWKQFSEAAKTFWFFDYPKNTPKTY